MIKKFCLSFALLSLLATATQAQIVARHIFYNNCAFDGNNPAANTQDDNAIASDKTPFIIPGDATFANYTSYHFGINGVMIDIQNVGSISAGDFEFHIGNDEDHESWATAPSPASITVRNGAGDDGSDRVTLIWADNAIRNTWLKITVKATTATGLSKDDIFFVGNAIGDCGDNPDNTIVDATDEINARNNPRHFIKPATIDDAHDYNRDGKVDAADQIIARNNPTDFTSDLTLLSFFNTGVPGSDLTVYHVGNSLTRGLSLYRMSKIFQSVGGDYDYGSQQGAGTFLYEHLAKKRSSGASFTLSSIESDSFGLYDEALQNHTFDALVLQPYMWWLNDRDPSNDIEKGDLQAASGFIDYATGNNPSNNVSTQRIYIYSTWPRYDGAFNRQDLDTDSSGIVSHTEFWNGAYDPSQYLPYRTVPNRDYTEQLVNGLNALHPELPVPVRLIPVGDVYAALDAKILAGTLPGVEAYFKRTAPFIIGSTNYPSNLDYYKTARTGNLEGFPLGPNVTPYVGFVQSEGVRNFYADKIHMNDQPHDGNQDGVLGSYVASLTFFTVMTGQNPVGTSVANFGRIDPILDAALVAAIQQTVWEVVTSDPLTGVEAE